MSMSLDYRTLLFRAIEDITAKIPSNTREEADAFETALDGFLRDVANTIDRAPGFATKLVQPVMPRRCRDWYYPAILARLSYPYA